MILVLDPYTSIQGCGEWNCLLAYPSLYKSTVSTNLMKGQWCLLLALTSHVYSPNILHEQASEGARCSAIPFSASLSDSCHAVKITSQETIALA